MLVSIIAVGWLLFSISSPSLKNRGGNRVKVPILMPVCQADVQSRQWTLTYVVLSVRVLDGGLGGRGRLSKFKVILAFFAHPVRVGAARVPLNSDPAILAQLSDDSAQTGSRAVLEHAQGMIRKT